MLNIPPNTTIYWHTEPTDMRKGIDGLSGIVRGEFDDDFNGHPLDGSLYLFINRRRDRHLDVQQVSSFVLNHIERRSERIVLGQRLNHAFN